MRNSKSSQATAPAPTEAGQQPSYRSGAVAQMVQMPVATLRVWERRYGLSQPALSASGQRRYSADDVQRLLLIKQLTDSGHAIGSLAVLDKAQLQQVAALHGQAQMTAAPARAWRLAVVGAALGTRVQRWALSARAGGGRPALLLGPFEDGAQAAAELQKTDRPDALLIHAPQLYEGWLADFDAAAPGLAGVPKALLYGFAADAVCEALAGSGAALLREPQPDVVLGQWLNSLSTLTGATAETSLPEPAEPLDLLFAPLFSPLSAEAAPPRRWDDAALADFAGRLSSVACECPRHVTELLLQLAHFETYSAGCANRNAADAALHAYLHRVAALSRAQFETALTQVALHEGLALPPLLPPTLPSPLPLPQKPALAAARPPRRR